MGDIEEKETKKTGFLSLAKVVFSTWIGVSFFWLFVLHKYSFWLQRSVLFMHFVRWPLSTDFSDALKCGLQGVRNFYLTTKDNVKIGVWHILPASLIATEPKNFEELLGNGYPIILYMHGNSGTRASHHRLELYKLLQKMNFHIIAFDYRSYGDSSDVLPDESGVVEDGKCVFRWIYSKKKSASIYVWGHSIGTGVSSRATTELENEGLIADGLVLESPFNNISDAIRMHPLAWIIKDMVGFEYFFVKPIVDNGISFRSDEYLSRSSIPLLILHAKDDWVIPVTLARRLYNFLLKKRPSADKTVKYVEFNSVGYGHKYICLSTEIQGIVKSFTNRMLEDIPSISK